MIQNEESYQLVQNKIEALIKKADDLGGFKKLSKEEVIQLEKWSKWAEQYEDSIPLMPIKPPKNLEEMLRLKMYEKNIRQKQLAQILKISESYLSGLISGKRKLTLDLAKKLHQELNIDAQFLLNLP